MMRPSHVRVKTSDGDITTMGALYDRWGDLFVEGGSDDNDDGYSFNPDQCLCAVHIPYSARKAGRKVSALESGDWIELEGAA